MYYYFLKLLDDTREEDTVSFVGNIFQFSGSVQKKRRSFYTGIVPSEVSKASHCRSLLFGDLYCLFSRLSFY